MNEFFGDPPVGFVTGGVDTRLEAAAAEVRCWPVDLGGVAEKQELMAMLADDLELPSWFGRNWDALIDVLSDPEQVGERAALLFSGRATLAEKQPALASLLNRVLLETQLRAAATGGALWLVDVPPDER